MCRTFLFFFVFKTFFFFRLRHSARAHFDLLGGQGPGRNQADFFVGGESERRRANERSSEREREEKKKSRG